MWTARVEWLGVAAGAALLSAHVGYESGLAAAAPSTRVAAAPPLALGALACALLAVTPRLAPALRRGEALAGAYVAVGLPLSAAAGVGDAFATAYAAALLLLVPIAAAHRAGIARYDPDSLHFVASRSATYATLRSVGAFATARGAVDARLGRLLPLALASVETVFMWLLGTSAYRFANARSLAVYALFKSALVVSLPLAEQAVLAA